MPAPAPEYQTPEPAPVVVQPSTQPQQQSQPGSNRRISKNILGGLEDAINNAASTQVEKIELTYDKVIEVFEQYKTKLRAENKSVYHAQFSSMQVEMIPPEEVRFIVNDDLVDAYAKDKRDELIGYFREHTGVMVRITTEVRKNENAPVQVKVLSKSEIYDEMAQKNPYLSQLKDGLNLQIDY